MPNACTTKDTLSKNGNGSTRNTTKIKDRMQASQHKTPRILVLHFTKQKDPMHKTRLIASYFKHPLKQTFRHVSRILTWLFTTVKDSYGMFTLYKLTDIKK